MSNEKQAEENLEKRLIDNPCRGLIVGLDETGNTVQLSWIMGRSPNSQNRVYEKDGSTVRTAPADLSKVKDPSLIIYNAMRSRGNVHIVSNGDQTDTIMNFLFNYDGTNLAERFNIALQLRYCEPDAPTRTPRISAAVESGNTTAHFSILRPDPILSAQERAKQIEQLPGDKFPTQRDFYERQLHHGLGYCLTTYDPGSKTLPAFTGDPFLVPTKGTLKEVMQNVWDHLESQWNVAIAGKSISPKGEVKVEIINKYTKVNPNE